MYELLIRAHQPIFLLGQKVLCTIVVKDSKNHPHQIVYFQKQQI